MNRRERLFGTLAICLQLVSVGTYCALIWVQRSTGWSPGKHLTRLDRILLVFSLMLLLSSQGAAIIGLIRDHKRGLAILAFVAMFILAILMGGFQGIS
jgi:hypothetical protein